MWYVLGNKVYINEMVLFNMLCNENFIWVKIKLVVFMKYIFWIWNFKNIICLIYNKLF